jgi:hypothetical protein
MIDLPFICPDCGHLEENEFTAPPPESGALVFCEYCEGAFRVTPEVFIHPNGVELGVAAEPIDPHEWLPEHLMREEWISYSEFAWLESLWLEGLRPGGWR